MHTACRAAINPQRVVGGGVMKRTTVHYGGGVVTPQNQ